MTGGAEKEALTGYDQLLLVICLYIYPIALADEICKFIVANGGDVYSRQVVTSRCIELNITRKRVSKEAYDAFSPLALQKLEWFRTRIPPLGVSGLDIWKTIDFDETGFYLSERLWKQVWKKLLLYKSKGFCPLHQESEKSQRLSWCRGR